MLMIALRDGKPVGRPVAVRTMSAGREAASQKARAGADEVWGIMSTPGNVMGRIRPGELIAYARKAGLRFI